MFAWIPSKDPHAAWGRRTARNHRSSKGGSRKRGGSKTCKSAGADAGETEASGQDSNKTASYHGYKVNFITDANYGLPLFAATRPATASDVTVMAQDLDDCLVLYRPLQPKYFVSDEGYDRLDNIVHVLRRGMIPVMAVRRPKEDKETGTRLYDGTYDEEGRPTCTCCKFKGYVETDCVLLVTIRRSRRAYLVRHDWLSIPQGVHWIHCACRVVDEVSDGGWSGASWNPSR